MKHCLLLHTLESEGLPAELRGWGGGAALNTYTHTHALTHTCTHKHTLYKHTSKPESNELHDCTNRRKERLSDALHTIFIFCLFLSSFPSIHIPLCGHFHKHTHTRSNSSAGSLFLFFLSCSILCLFHLLKCDEKCHHCSFLTIIIIIIETQKTTYLFGKIQADRMK